jgi:acetyl esterase/lipase
MEPHRVSRRRALGVLGGITLGVGGLVALVRSGGSYGPAPRTVQGTVREVETYGEGLRRGEWWLPPDAPPGLLPTVVLVHGGYWKPGYDRSLENAVAADLAGWGFLCWNLDYAASDRPWPTTLLDVAAGYDHLATGRFADRVDPGRVAVVGHSAGGHLALWLGSRGRLPAGAPGAGAVIPTPALIVAQAPVAALARASSEGLGGGAATALVGGTPAQVPERYRVTDPTALLPTGVPTVLVHGRDDAVVPLSQSETYVAAALAAGDDSRLVVVEGGHFEHLDPESPASTVLREALERLR